VEKRPRPNQGVLALQQRNRSVISEIEIEEQMRDVESASGIRGADLNLSPDWLLQVITTLEAILKPCQNTNVDILPHLLEK